MVLIIFSALLYHVLGSSPLFFILIYFNELRQNISLVILQVGPCHFIVSHSQLNIIALVMRSDEIDYAIIDRYLLVRY